MSILQYFTVTKKSRSSDQLCSTLPDPRGPLSDKVPTDTITSANAALQRPLRRVKLHENRRGVFILDGHATLRSGEKGFRHWNS